MIKRGAGEERQSASCNRQSRESRLNRTAELQGKESRNPQDIKGKIKEWNLNKMKFTAGQGN